MVEGRARSEPERLETLRVEVRSGRSVVQDQFLWDVHDLRADPDAFARRLGDDLDLPSAAVAAFACQLRREILHVWRLASGSLPRPSEQLHGRGQAALYSGGLRAEPVHKGSAVRRTADWDIWRARHQELTDAELGALLERERVERERLRREKEEQERLEQERLEQERLERERLAQEEAARLAREQEEFLKKQREEQELAAAARAAAAQQQGVALEAPPLPNLANFPAIPGQVASSATGPSALAQVLAQGFQASAMQQGGGYPGVSGPGAAPGGPYAHMGHSPQGAHLHGFGMAPPNVGAYPGAQRTAMAQHQALAQAQQAAMAQHAQQFWGSAHQGMPAPASGHAHVPGHMPGQMPGHMPGQMPGQGPGQLHGHAQPNLQHYASGMPGFPPQGFPGM